MSVELLKSVFDIGAVILLFLTFAFAAGVLITGNIINSRQENQLRQFDKDLTEAKTELGMQQERAAKANERASEIEAGNLQLQTDLANATAESRSKQTALEMEQRKTAEAQKSAAEAQLALNRSMESFANRTGFRVLKVDEFIGILKSKPKETAEIWYKAGDAEVERFSVDLYRGFDTLGWPASRRPLHESDVLSGINVGAIDGLFIFANGEEQASDVFHALLQSLQFGGTASSSTAPELPTGKVVVVIGPRTKM